MNIVILSGGSGKRLWPLSNEDRSKQFLRILEKEGGDHESMLQRVYHQIEKSFPNSNIVIATSKSQVSAIQNHLGEDVSICIEPERRNTYPAILLASAFIKEEKHLHDNDTIIVIPVDPYVDEEYFKALKELEEMHQNNNFNLSLMGAIPTLPSEKYGYIIPQSKEKRTRVKEFKEKPSKEKAEEYIKEGGLWNCGVFAFRLSYLLKGRSYEEIYNNYKSLNKISFDYEVVEKEKNIGLLRFSGLWKDIGTWNTITDVIAEHKIGNVTFDDDTENTYVINELNIPLLCMGIKDTIIASSSDGILVTSREKSPYIKEYAERIATEVKYSEKSWGSFRIIDKGKDFLTIKITLLSGHMLNYHCHDKRDEVWTILSGEGIVILDGERRKVNQGETIKLKRGVKHSIKAITELEVIEVQYGEEIAISDKAIFPNPLK